MPEALSSFLISVGIIVAAALVVPCIESIVKLLHRNAPPKQPASAKPSKSYRREVA